MSDTSVSNPLLLFKYGGNAMTDEDLKNQVLQAICRLKEEGFRVVIVHGGGPFIQEALDAADIHSEFVDGHRRTSPEALQHVEMALKGRVNGNLVNMINKLGQKAVGLSGKDGQIVLARKREHYQNVDGEEVGVDLGRVGAVDQVQPQLLHLLLENDYIPVITCLAADAEGTEYNINGDLFAGQLAGALGADEFIVLTDVPGLMRDINDPDSLMQRVEITEIDNLAREGIIKGGMLPKLDACRVALQKGAGAARIINGTEPGQIEALRRDKSIGTLITDQV